MRAACVLALACAPDPVPLKCLDEGTFYREYAVALCRGAADCGDLWGATEEECVEIVADGNSEEEGRLLRVCPAASYDPCEASACLDQMLHSPPRCGPEGVLVSCGKLDWYHGLCSAFEGTE